MAAGDLTRILRGLLAAAGESTEPARYTLKGGLQISVRRVGDLIGLQLSRAGEPGPSRAEWRTVLAHWPGGTVGGLEPDQIRLGGRVYLQAHWPYQPPLLLDEPSPGA